MIIFCYPFFYTIAVHTHINGLTLLSVDKYEESSIIVPNFSIIYLHIKKPHVYSTLFLKYKFVLAIKIKLCIYREKL